MSAPGRAPGGKLPLPLAAAFSGAFLPTVALYVAIGVYLPQFFASHIGLSLGAVGAAFAAVRAADMLVDPLLGMAMDRTRTRFGRYRVWLALGVPVMMAGSAALFMARRGVGEAYLIGWLFVLYVGYSIMALSHSAWTATLATDYHDRSRVFGIQAVAGVIGALVILAIPVVGGQTGGDNASAVAAMGWFLVISPPVTVALALLVTPEHVAPDPVEKQRFRPSDYLALALRPSLLRLLIADLCLSLGPNWMSALYIFFFTASRGFSAADASLLLGLYVAAGLVGAPVTARIARRLGKHVALMATSTAYSLGLCCVMAIPKGSMAGAAPVLFWCGFMAAGFNFLTRAMLADISDEVRLEGGVERTSLLYALTNFTAKLASACAIGLTFWVLAALGYDPTPGAVNTPAAIHGLEIAFLAGPICFVMAGGASCIGYRLDARRHAEIRRQLDARDAEMAGG